MQTCTLIFLCTVSACVSAPIVNGQGVDDGARQIESPASTSKQPLPTTTIRVLSFNIHHGEGDDGRLDLERIANVIKSSNADLVALQEVDRNTTRTGNIDQADMLAKLTKMNFVFGANIDLQGGEYGNAVLSRFPIIKSQYHPLPRRDQGEQRGVLEVEIKSPSGDSTLRLMATHFDHRSDDRERVDSAKYINQLIVRRDQTPAILAGDLNDGPASRTLMELENQWQRTNDTVLPTIPVDHPQRQIDFVLVRPIGCWTLIETRVLDEPVASDHRPIIATLQLSEPVRDAED